MEHIAGWLPYPQHVDEAVITGPATDILRFSDWGWHPGTFNYPSLPTYLAVAAMGVGFVLVSSELGSPQGGVDITDDLGDVWYPFYTVPGIVEKARWLFALLSVVALAMSGVVTYQLLGRPSALILGSSVLALAHFFFSMSWSYLNVDIVGACFVMLGMVATLKGTRSLSSLRWCAVIPAICVGLAGGSKYTYGLFLVSVLLAIYLFVERGRWLRASVKVLAVAGLSFLAVVPYSVIDLPAFLNGLAASVKAYNNAYPGHEANPGLDQLAFYVSGLARDFGDFGLILCLLGLISAVVSDWRRTLVIVSFPVALLALLSAQKVHFLRNIIPVYPYVAVFIACGIYFLHGCLMRVIRRIEVRGLQSAIGVVGFLGIFALGLNVPLVNFAKQMDFAGENRVQAVAWIEKHIATDTTIIIPEELFLDTRPLVASGYSTRVAAFKSLDSVQRIDSLIAEIHGPVVLLVPKWIFDTRPADTDEAKAKAAALNEVIKQAQLVPLVDFRPFGVFIGAEQGADNPGFSIAAPPARPIKLRTSLTP